MSDWSERIFLALDATVETGPAIDLAMRLAVHAGLRLHVVFVEDQDLLEFAASPIAREVVVGAGGGRSRIDELELHLRAAAGRAQHDVRAAARKHALEFSFEIVRGAAETALSAAGERDLIVAGGLARPVAGHFRVESRWLAALAIAPRLFLLAKETRKNRSRVAVLLRGRGAAAARLLRTAARLAQLEGGALSVICTPELSAATDLEDWVKAQVVVTGVRPEIETASADSAALQTRLAELNCGLVALDAASAEPGQLTALTRRFDGAVLVVN